MHGLLRFDGLYVCVVSDRYAEWFRFDPRGTVLTATTTPASARQVATWLRPSSAHASKGAWVLDGARLTLDATSTAGRVDYDGLAAGDTLRLRSHSHITDHSAEGEWRFVPLDATALDGDLAWDAYPKVRSLKDLARAQLPPDALAAIQSKVSLVRVLTATPAELAALAGIAHADATALCAWRDTPRAR